MASRLGNALTIRVMAPPEKGKAIDSVAELLAKKRGLSADHIEVDGGHSSPSKMIAITGMDDEAIKQAFE